MRVHYRPVQVAVVDQEALHLYSHKVSATLMLAFYLNKMYILVRHNVQTNHFSREFVAILMRPAEHNRCHPHQPNIHLRVVIHRRIAIRRTLIIVVIHRMLIIVHGRKVGNEDERPAKRMFHILMIRKGNMSV